MAEIGSWGGQKFEVKSGYVQGFTGLSVKGSSETEDKESGGEKYVSRKNGKPTEIGLTIHLNALTGCKNVRDTAMWFVDKARAGKKDYFYIKNGKLVPCQVMLTEANVKEIKMTNAADWICCDVQLTLKQCTKWDGTTGSSGSSGGSSGGSSSSSSGGGGKTYTATVYYSASSGAVQSVTRTSTVSYDDALKKAYAAVPSNAQWASTNPQQATNQTPAKSTTSTVASTVTKVVNTVKQTAQNIVNTATSVINKLVTAAKTASTAAKTTTTTTTKTTTTTVAKPNVKTNKVLLK